MTDKFQAFLDSGASFEGKLCFTGLLRVDGHLQGEISSDGTLVVGETGVVEATLQVPVQNPPRIPPPAEAPAHPSAPEGCPPRARFYGSQRPTRSP